MAEFYYPQQKTKESKANWVLQINKYNSRFYRQFFLI